MITFPVQEFVPGVEMMCVWEGGFTPEECDRIIDQAEGLEFRKGRVGQDHEDGKIRDSTVTWIPTDHDHHWIFERLSALVARVNFDKFQLELHGLDGVQYTKYALNQHYSWHMDMHPGEPRPLHRKLSMVTLLAEPDQYEGGDLVFMLHGNPNDQQRIRPKRGDVVFFYSFVPHAVEPVTSGERVSLVTWVLGPKLL